MPVFGSAMAILLLGEQLRLFHLVGYALVLAGVVIASRRASAGRREQACGVASCRLPLSIPGRLACPPIQHKNILRKRPYDRVMETVSAHRRSGPL